MVMVLHCESKATPNGGHAIADVKAGQKTIIVGRLEVI